MTKNQTSATQIMYVLKLRNTLYAIGLILLATCITPINAQAGLDIDWRVVQDPRIKEAVFDLHQGNYFTGINRLIALRSYGNLEEEAELAELLLGTFYLAYGMPAESTEIYLDLLDKGTDTITQEQLWFHVAKTQYQRASYAAAEKSLTHIKGNLGSKLGEQQILLETLLLMRKNQFGKAVDLLQQINSSSEFSLYAYYNLAVSLAKVGRREDSIKTFEAISNIGGSNDSEMNALKDKSNVALGYIYLNNSEPQKAKYYMQQVQLQSPLANKALLGLGWSYSALNEHKKSLVAWMELTSRAKNDSSVMEGYLAIPHAYEKLKALSQSLQEYEKAIQNYKKSQTRIDKLITAINKNGLLTPILNQPRDRKLNLKKLILTIPEPSDRKHLMYIFASNEFQEAFKSYNELKFLSKRLLTWETTIEKFHGISTTFREAYMDRILQQQAQTDKTLDELEDYIKTVAINSLQVQSNKITKFISKAKFSMARIYDESNQYSARE